jgi:hypothetical protein
MNYSTGLIQKARYFGTEVGDDGFWVCSRILKGWDVNCRWATLSWRILLLGLEPTYWGWQVLESLVSITLWLMKCFWKFCMGMKSDWLISIWMLTPCAWCVWFHVLHLGLYRRNKKVYAWTVDDVDSMQKMLFERVDAVVTSNPTLLQRLMQDTRTQCLEEGFSMSQWHSFISSTEPFLWMSEYFEIPYEFTYTTGFRILSRTMIVLTRSHAFIIMSESSLSTTCSWWQWTFFDRWYYCKAFLL